MSWFKLTAVVLGLLAFALAFGQFAKPVTKPSPAVLHAGQIVRYDGVDCLARRRGITCLRADGRGYGVFVSRSFVEVGSEAGVAVFRHRQP